MKDTERTPINDIPDTRPSARIKARWGSGSKNAAGIAFPHGWTACRGCGKEIRAYGGRWLREEPDCPHCGEPQPSVYVRPPYPEFQPWQPPLPDEERKRLAAQLAPELESWRRKREEAERKRREAFYWDIAASIARYERENRNKRVAEQRERETLIESVHDVIPLVVGAVRDTVYERSMLADEAAICAENPHLIGQVSKKMLKSWKRVVRLLDAAKRGSNRNWPGQDDIDAVSARLTDYLEAYFQGVDNRRKNPGPNAQESAKRIAKLAQPGFEGMLLGCRALDQISGGGWSTIIREAEREAERRQKRAVGDRQYQTSVRRPRTGREAALENITADYDPEH